MVANSLTTISRHSSFGFYFHLKMKPIELPFSICAWESQAGFLSWVLKPDTTGIYLDWVGEALGPGLKIGIKPACTQVKPAQ